jgi:DNA-binding NarL/FixJ family response regulator
MLREHRQHLTPPPFATTIGRMEPPAPDPDFSRRVLVVEDEPLIQQLIRDVLHAAGFDARIESDAAAAVEAFDAFDPDALLVDIDLGTGPNGIEFAEAIRLRAPYLGIVFLTRVADPRLVGASFADDDPNVAFLRKQDVDDRERIIEAMEAVLADAADESVRHDLTRERAFTDLTRTQLEVLRLVAAGASNTEIARQRGTSLRGAESLLRRTFAAADIDSTDPALNARVMAARAFLDARGASS